MQFYPLFYTELRNENSKLREVAVYFYNYMCPNL